MHRILIVNVNWLGDVLFSTPAIRAIRESCPHSFIACMVVSRCQEILQDNPNLDEVILFDEKGIHRGLGDKLKMVFYLKKKRFDTAFLFHRSFTRTLMITLAGIPQRIGYYTKKRGFLLTLKVPPPSKYLHRVEYFLKIISSVGIEARDKRYEMFVSRSDRDYIRKVLNSNRVGPRDFLVVINPGGNWFPKRWPKENFARLAQELQKLYGAKIVITGANYDFELALDIAKFMQEKPLIFAGRTNLKQLAALLERADLMISADTGPMHIACAVGAKVVAIFGPTSASITGPYGRGNYLLLQKDVGCLTPCYEVSCQDNRCMKAITVEEVLEKIKVFLSLK